MSEASAATHGTYCGFIAIVGRPNVGKSTLLNHLVGQKLSITSRKPQTTRHTLLGIKTEGDTQFIYVDTPGLHSDQQRAINRYMNKAASSALHEVDVAVFVVDRTVWTEADASVAELLIRAKLPVVIVVNKIDRVADKISLLPHVQWLSEQLDNTTVVPVSALQGNNLDELERAIRQRLPKGLHLYAEDQITDRTERFLAAELIREKITRQLGAEVPYQVTVQIEEFRQEGNLRHISALILVEREGQKRILIGEKGARLKQIGQQARLDMEQLFDGKVMLNLWVKVRSGWSDDERALRSLGYD